MASTTVYNLKKTDSISFSFENGKFSPLFPRKRILWMNAYCKMASGSGDKIDPAFTELTWKDERVWQ
jgi:hypothetical protein